MRRPLVVLAIFAAFVLVACGGDDDDVDATATTESTTTMVETTTAPATTTIVMDPAPVDPSDPRSVIAAYVTSDALHWPDDVVVEPGDEPDAFRVTEASLGLEANVIVDESGGEYSIEHFSTTFGGEDVPASVSLGNGNDSVAQGWEGPEDLVARLRITYGADGALVHEEEAEVGQGASWTFDLGPEDTSTRFVEVTFVDPHDQVAREVWSTLIPAGPFAAG